MARMPPGSELPTRFEPPRSSVLVVVNAFGSDDVPAVLLGLAWGIAVSVVATVQLAFALRIDFAYTEGLQS